MLDTCFALVHNSVNSRSRPLLGRHCFALSTRRHRYTFELPRNHDGWHILGSQPSDFLLNIVDAQWTFSRTGQQKQDLQQGFA